ncbi:septum site-determining protein MinC [Anaerotignum propionicum]|nr:septum site-determining protein MinC [Anaerotignum propionicum]AMJ39724.1 septum site-determining protein MinC [Anaerotignum propionicum DSM 1682]SHE29537.1 septum site-determining protein MinC [[Clostridium] propionicum DSM 1682] [Anaerotignum propionicum DSM 1682]
MNLENYVIFKGTKDGVTVLFHDDAPFEVLCEQLDKKVQEAGKFFDNVKTSLAFKGRTFSDEEEQQLLRIITEHTTMEITFLKTENNELLHLTNLLEKEMSPHNLTKFHKGSLRNGQRIDFDGSVVIIGDVNPGAELKATGNIIVLGQLKGMAHAGCQGMSDAFIAAVYMAPVQLRIGDIITRFPDENKRGIKSPEYAFVQEGQIFVMALS